jgi:propane monooxygenase coupling protein
VSEQPEQFENDRTATNRCGVTMSASVEGNTIAELMGEKEGVEVVKYPAMIRIDANDKLDLEEIAEALGVEEFSPEDFEIETSTHYGRMVRQDDRVLLFANPEDAAEAIGFTLPEVDQQ